MITFTHSDSYHNTCQGSWNFIFGQIVLPSQDTDSAQLTMTDSEYSGQAF